MLTTADVGAAINLHSPALHGSITALDSLLHIIHILNNNPSSSKTCAFLQKIFGNSPIFWSMHFQNLCSVVHSVPKMGRQETNKKHLLFQQLIVNQNSLLY